MLENKNIHDSYRAWVEISACQLNKNLQQIKNKIAPAAVFAVLKANAYGLGAVNIASSLNKNLIEGFCVANFEEAEELLKFNKKILILGVLLECETYKAIQNNICVTITSAENALIVNNIAKRLNKVAKCHINIDTGMGRLGLLHYDSVEKIKSIVKLENIECEGLFSHFPNAFGINEFTVNQIDVFREIIKKLMRNNINFKYIHFGNSDANNNYSTLISQLPFNSVRTGLSLYGFVDSGSNKNIDLGSVLSIKSRLVDIKKVPKSYPIGYGSKYLAQKEMYIGIVSMGYADGLPLNLSNRGFVIVNDILCPIIGRVSMDYTTISLDQCDVDSLTRGQEVVCVGNSYNHSIALESWAQIKGTHPYDILCSLGERVRKVYI